MNKITIAALGSLLILAGRVGSLTRDMIPSCGESPGGDRSGASPPTP